MPLALVVSSSVAPEACLAGHPHHKVERVLWN